MLARFQVDQGAWLRVPDRSLLAAGERLVVLPSYRPQIAISGVQVNFCGEAAFQMQTPDEAGVSRLEVAYGRMLALNQGAKAAKLHVNLSGLMGTATLSKPDSSLALEVRPYLPPGGSPLARDGAPSEAYVVVELHALGGTVVWQEAGNDISPVEIEPGMVRTYIGSQPPTQSSASHPAPDWIDSRKSSLFDQQTTLDFESRLTKDRPLSISLEEALTDRRVEVRALAAISLGAIDNFEPLFKELTDIRQYSYWAAEVDALRQAMARGPRSVAMVQAAIEKFRASEAPLLQRMLVGYGPQQLAEGGGKELVDLLENSEMDLRVLASDNLRIITGASFNYRPEKRNEFNKNATNRWRERLKEGKITWTVPPSPITPRKPAGK